MTTARPHQPFPWKAPGFPHAGQRFALGRLLAREPHYARLWRQSGNLDALEAAGFFDDGLDRQQCAQLGLRDGFAVSRRQWSTPLPDPAQLKDLPAGPRVVLLTTGSFAPVHEGHWNMLSAAESALRAQGITPAASYLSPSHDLYVATKDGGRGQDYPANLRLDLARASARLHPSPLGVPRFVDPWESLIAPRPLNFTTVIARLEAYLSWQWHCPVLVVYVYGADNAGFAEAFPATTRSGVPHAVCVGRPGATIRHHAGVLPAPANHTQSSTQLRREAPPQPVQEAAATGVYLVRDEGEFAWSHWRHRVPASELAPAWRAFSDLVLATLSEAFEQNPGPRPSAFRRLPLEPQLVRVVAWAPQSPIISLDACLEDVQDVVSWPSSRRFRIADHQHAAHARGLRPGTQWPSSLPAHALLVDDDQATGDSVRLATEALSARGTTIDGVRFLLHEEEEDIFDVVDLRDFLPGARAGGLVVEAPTGQCSRVPYLAPFVDLATRARLPQGLSWSVSAKLWSAAAEFFERLSVTLTVADMDAPQRQAFLDQGYAPDLPLARLCRIFAGAVV